MSRFNKHVVIVGTARSGTSWLSETMAAQYRYRLLFEPEHETQTKKGYLLCDKWITTENVSRKADQYLRQVFANRVDSDWIAQNSNRKFKRHLWPFIPKKFIIKFVRGSLLAEYVATKFGIPVIHLLRSPYEVLKSQQKVKFPWLYDLSHFTEQKTLVALIKNRFDIDISDYNSSTDLEKLTVRWCIENVIPIEVFDNYSSKVNVIRYEDLFSDINTFYNLCMKFDLEPVNDLESRYIKPSSKTNPHENILQKTDNKHVWNSSELQSINMILDQFSTKLYPRQ